MSSEDFNLEAAEKEVEENPCNTKVLSDLGQYYAHKSEFPLAIRYYEKIVRISEENARAWSALGHCYLLNEDYLKCVTAYQKSLTNKEESLDIHLWYGIGQLYFCIEDWKHSETVFSAMLRIENEFLAKFDLHFKLGIIFFKQNQLEKSKIHLEKSLEFSHIPVPKKIEALLYLAQIFYLTKNTEESISFLESALKLDPLHIKTLKVYSWLLFSMEKYEESISLLNKSLQSVKPSSELHYILARNYFSLKDFESSRKNYTVCVSLAPECFIYWVSIGILYAETHQFSDAFECFSKALTFCMESYELWNNISILYTLCGQKNESELALQKSELFNLGQKKSFPRSDISLLQHITFDINEAISKQKDTNFKKQEHSEVVSLLERTLNQEFFKVLEANSNLKNDEKQPEIVVPVVANSRKNNEKGTSQRIEPRISDPRLDPRINPAQMAAFQSMMMNPMLLYSMFMNSAMMSRNIAHNVNPPNKEICDGKVKEEQEQIAKTLIELNEDIPKKKNKPTENDDTKKKFKEDDN